jgi:hypothetical protein
MTHSNDWIYEEIMRKPDIGLLRVSKKVASEAVERFYSHNTFYWDTKTPRPSGSQRTQQSIEQWYVISILRRRAVGVRCLLRSKWFGRHR